MASLLSTTINSVLTLSSEITLKKNNSRNLEVQGAGNTDCGIVGKGAGGEFAFQIYGNNNAEYGFLNGVWASWDLRKVPNGNLFFNNNNAYYLNPPSTSYLSSLTVANTISGSINGNAATATNVTISNLNTQQVTTGTLTSGSWYTIAVNAGDRASGKFTITNGDSGLHQVIQFYATAHYGTDTGAKITVVSNTYYAGPPISAIRILRGSTYDGAMVQVYSNVNCSITISIYDNQQSGGWVIKNGIISTTNPGGVSVYGNLGTNASQVDLSSGKSFSVADEIYIGGATTQYKALHANNYSSYALPLTGGTLSGVLYTTKPINTTGATYGSQASYVGNWSGAGWWGLGSESGHIIKFDQVAYADMNAPTWIGATDITLKLGTKTVLDSSNYTSYPDATKLPLAGGTLTGALSGTSASFSGDASCGGQIQIRNASPTITLRDTDHRTGYIHVNSNIFYVLTGPADSASGGWGIVANSRWPLEINLSNNNATFGGDVNAISFSGPLTGNVTGNVTGNCSGSSGSCTGNAVTATTAGALTGGDSNFNGLLYNALNGDLNTYNSPGLYSAEYTGTTNKPSGYGNGHFIQISDAGGTDVKTQWYTQSDGAKIGMRVMWGNTNWQAWRSLLHDGNYSSYALPLSGGTLTGVLTTYTPGVQTSITNLSAFNAGVNVGERSVGSVAGFVPGYGQTTVYSGGYRSHMILGSYRTASAWGGGPFIAWGGNDSYPTEYWLFNQGGAITHSSGVTFLNTNSTLTAGNLSGTIPSGVLGNSTHYIGTTAIALNRGSASQSLTGINIDGSSGSCTGNAASATLATKASTLSQGGGNGSAMTFNWAGQSGQPTWLWGSNDGTNIYVWNPSNFNVNSAASVTGTVAIANGGTGATTAANARTNLGLDARVRAWCHFDGTPPSATTLNANFNVSSVTKNGTGDYTVNFTSAFANAYYTVAGTSQLDNVGQSNYNTFVAVPRRSGAQATGSCRVVSEYPAGVALYDAVSFRVEFVAA